jgi:hypothetical protein
LGSPSSQVRPLWVVACYDGVCGLLAIGYHSFPDTWRYAGAVVSVFGRDLCLATSSRAVHASISPPRLWRALVGLRSGPRSRDFRRGKWMRKHHARPLCAGLAGVIRTCHRFLLVSVAGNNSETSTRTLAVWVGCEVLLPLGGLASRCRIVTWLILPVVICLSQRLSHACLSISNLYSETANGSLNQLSFI